MTTYQHIHDTISIVAREKMPGHIARLQWTRQQIQAFQLHQLQNLLEHAITHSRYYQSRCRSIDLSTLTLDNLKQIPPSTKKDILENWDEMICVQSITKQKAEHHLKLFRDNMIDNPFYHNNYYVTATGGSSGLRGLFAWNLDYFADIACVVFRYQMRDEASYSKLRKIAVLTAPTLIHASPPLFTLQMSSTDELHFLAADLPITTLTQQLNELQPSHLYGYSSVIAELANQQLHGTLSITPTRVATNSELLDDEDRHRIQKAWEVIVNNMWGSVEMGIAGIESDEHKGLILSEDMIIFEPVDEQLQPVQAPQDAKKLIITNLFNKTLPLIRYVVDDVVEIIEADYTAYRIAKHIRGRTDDWFNYHDLKIHPMVFRHTLGQDTNISEYLVEQTIDGAIIRIVTTGIVDATRIAQQIEHSLNQAGLAKPHVIIEQMKAIPRHQETGKIKRFIPLI